MSEYKDTLGAAFFIISEDDYGLSRDNGTVGENQNIAAGSLVAAVTNAGETKLVAFDPSKTTSEKNPVGISLYDVKTGAGETKAAAIFSRLGQVNGKTLVWPAGITDAQKNTAIAALAALMIAVR